LIPVFTGAKSVKITQEVTEL